MTPQAIKYSVTRLMGGLIGASFAWMVLAQAPVTRAAVLLDSRALVAVERFAGAWRGTRTATYRDVKRELMRDGTRTLEEVRIKLQLPLRAYLFMLRPVRGREVLYDQRKDPRQMIVHPGHFPDITLSLDIEGKLAARDQHHTMAEVGFDETLRVLQAELERAQREPRGERLEWLGARRFDGRAVEVVRLVAGSRPGRNEAARGHESLFAFARRVGMEPYVIFVANPSLSSLSSKLEGGRNYVVPAYRASRTEYWFEVETGMLLKQVAWNAQNELYESYEHFEMRLNPTLTDRDFDRDNPAYGF